MRWNYSQTVLLLCMLAFFVTMVGRLVISPLVPLITADFEISNASIGLALSFMWLTYALAQFPSGVLADKFGEKRVILLSVGGTAVVSCIILFAPMYPVFFIGVLLLGAVAGLHYTVATALLSRTFDDIGTAIGYHAVGSPLAGLIAPIVAAWIGFRYGWRLGIALTIVVAIPVFLFFFVGIRPTKPRNPDQRLRSQFQASPLLELLLRPSVAFTVCLSVLTGFVAQAVFSFLPTFLVEHQHHSPTFAAAIFSAFFVVKSVAQIGVGKLSDTFGRDIAVIGCMTAGTIGLGLFIIGSGFVELVLAVVFVGIGMSYAAALHARFLDQFSSEELGIGFGLVRTVYGILAASGSVVVGVFADQFNWAIAFGLLIILLAIVVCSIVVNHLFSLDY